MMKKNHRVQVTIAVVLVALLAAANLSYAVPPAAGQPVELARTGQPEAQAGEASRDDPPAGLTADEQATILDLIREAQYQFTWQVSNGVWAYRAPNRANDLSLSLAADGFHAVRHSAAGEPLWDFGLSLAAYGNQTFPAAIAEDGLVGSRERVEYHWSQDVVEWYINSANGVEHGLTLAAPPVGADGSAVELTFALRGSLTAKLDANGRTLRLKDASGQTALLYDQLAVYDAKGRSLPAFFSLSPGRLGITIDTSGATYPFTVDPILHDQAAKLTASDADDKDYFGKSVAISGDTAVVGAHGGESTGTDRGAAYVFERNKDESGATADNWGLVKRLHGFDCGDYDAFGFSVSISGSTIIVGAPGVDNVGVGNCQTGDDCGAAYIFERNYDMYTPETPIADNWGQVTKLTAGDDAADSAFFGTSVAISGDTVIVGAPSEDDVSVDRGAAYIFERNEGGGDQWGQVRRLTTSVIQDYTVFGKAVAISGDTVVVGSYGEDGTGDNRGAAYIFARNQNGSDLWGQVARLAASDEQDFDNFGEAVSISGDAVVVGAPGNDGAADNGGAAYIFERNYDPSAPGTPKADNWGQVKKLTASDAETSDNFGHSVAIGVDTVVVGAYYEDGPGGQTSNSGAAYVFERNQGGADSWGQVIKLTTSDAEAGDRFGRSVAVSGDTLIVGADLEDGAAEPQNSDRGAAYLFVGGNGQWQETAIPRAGDAEDGDRFGISVAISGDTAVVGADWEDGAGNKRGAAYVIERNQEGGDSWGQVIRLTADDAEDLDYFGRSVAIDNDTVVVGAWGKNGTGGNQRGAAYVFERNEDGAATKADNWGQVEKLIATSAEDYDYFGWSVAISGDTIVVGARGEDGAGTDRGAAYIFKRNRGGTDSWSQLKKLTASDTENDDNFGYSVAISGDTLIAGAYGEDGAGTDRGAAYIFERNFDPAQPYTPWADHWGEIAKLTALDSGDGDRFGYSVAISNDTVVVGAYLEDGWLGDDRGAAYVFERNKDGSGTSADSWGEVKKLIASDTADDDYFGRSVAISGDTAVVGADGENGFGLGTADDKGAAYVFERNQIGLPDFWGEVTQLKASDAANNDYFGYSVAVSGDQILVGAYGEDGDGTDRGAAYVYRWEPLTEPEITVSPGSLAFGDRGVDAGPSGSGKVTITNDGDGDLNISSVGLTGADAAEFAIESDSGEATLAPGATRTVYVSFDPSSEGAKSAGLSITSDDGDEATVNVALSGTGVPGTSGWYVFLPLVVNDD